MSNNYNGVIETRKQDDSSSPNTVEEYAHDALGRMTLARLTRGGTEHSDVRYYYDALARLTRESQKIKGGTARNIDYSYAGIPPRNSPKRMFQKEQRLR